ncbi:MAG: ketoacyl-ACP synthase III [Hydrogenovibrio sp.]
MIAITHIGAYLPENRVSNLALLDKFETDESFIRDKIGVVQRAVKTPEQKASDLCIKAFENLTTKADVDVEQIDCCVVITQNPDLNIPHTSAIVHGALNLPESCASFDISLGCSGYVYGLSILTAFMQANGFKTGLLFTADPYSDIVDPDDKNTALIFGDGATVSLLQAEQPGLVALGYDFGSKGAGYKNLVNENKLYMNGRAVFNFTAGVVPKSIISLLHKLAIDKDDVDQWFLHQGSKYIVDTISARLRLDPEKIVFGMQDYGNTVSSSIPMLLSEQIENIAIGQKVAMSGFGVGLSWASAIFEKKGN